MSEIVILAYRNGLLCACKVLEERGPRVRVKVVDNKRPQWIDTTQDSPKLFPNTDRATEWVDNGGGK